MPEITMPISTVKTKAGGCGDVVVTKKLSKGNIGKIVVSVEGDRATSHPNITKFPPNIECPRGGPAPFSSRYRKIINKVIAFIGIKPLVR